MWCLNRQQLQFWPAQLARHTEGLYWIAPWFSCMLSLPRPRSPRFLSISTVLLIKCWFSAGVHSEHRRFKPTATCPGVVEPVTQQLHRTEIRFNCFGKYHEVKGSYRRSDTSSESLKVSHTGNIWNLSLWTTAVPCVPSQLKSPSPTFTVPN